MTFRKQAMRNITNGPKLEQMMRLLSLALNRSAPLNESREAMWQAVVLAREHLIDFQEVLDCGRKTTAAPPADSIATADVEEVKVSPPASKVGNTAMPFGKFVGYPLSCVYRVDQDYLFYVLGKFSHTHPALCADIRTFLKSVL